MKDPNHMSNKELRRYIICEDQVSVPINRLGNEAIRSCFLRRVLIRHIPDDIFYGTLRRPMSTNKLEVHLGYVKALHKWVLTFYEGEEPLTRAVLGTHLLNYSSLDTRISGVIPGYSQGSFKAVRVNNEWPLPYKVEYKEDLPWWERKTLQELIIGEHRVTVD